MQLTSKVNPRLLEEIWKAKWITHPEILGKEIGLYFFKRLISLETLPKDFIINISADNRYKFYVNGQLVCNGPARGNLLKWRYETVDIASYLTKGQNVIAVEVWNFSELRPMAQFTVQTGLIIQGNTAQEEIINTNQEWKVMRDAAHSFYPILGLTKYYVTGPGELFTCDKYVWQWQDAHFENEEWLNARELEEGKTIRSIGDYGNIPTYALYPSEIPLMESKKQFLGRIRKCEGIDDASSLLTEEGELVVAKNCSVSILLDQEILTNAYPKILFGKGKGSQIKMTYAESLFEVAIKDGKEEITRHKGNRNEIEGKKIKGHYDCIVVDGGLARFYGPLWWRTFRYIQLDITTQDEPLYIQQFYSLFTGYPLVEQATFSSNNPLLSDIFKVGWRTQRLCAGESFVDCPYYEQLQYIGDARVQSLVTFYVSGDTGLWKKSITDFYDSRLPIGITQSRYPSYDPQLIPTFSLIWITMLWDYLRHCDDSQFIDQMLPAVLDILQWFEDRRMSNGFLGRVEGWNFVDWVEFEEWETGVPPMAEDGSSAVISLQYIYTIQKAVEVFDYLGMLDLGQKWKNIANDVQKAVWGHCWNAERGLLADTTKKNTFSQHANIFAVLTDTIPQAKQQGVIKQICKGSALAQSSYYFKFYLSEAIKKVECGELYVEMLSTWEAMLQNGLTTFMEEPEPSRSDCHAWSSSPLYYFFSLICGVEPENFGFEKVCIAPDFCGLEWIEGKVPHRYGDIYVKLKKSGKKGVLGQISLPNGLEGCFYWKEHQLELKSGITEIVL
ncbi:MAG: alpha-L-rhamnosidase [Aureispira sp.]|nr:alpha-L-rhamnosidase [Aureispira sp.]